MRAIVVRQFGPPEVMKVENVEEPSPAEGQVLVRIGAAGVNPVDTYVRSGVYARVPNLPYTPGSDLAGTVERVGSNVSMVKPGDRVYAHGVAPGSGAYASHALCAEHQIHPLPPRVTFAQGAAMGVPYATAWRALFIRGRARAGETVFIHGASGGVGSAAVQMARAHGLTVIGTAGTPDGLTLVREQGAHHVVSHRESDYLDCVMQLTGGRGVDLILEMLANVNLDRDLGLLAPKGRVVVIGSRGRVEIDPRQTMGKETAVLGTTLGSSTPAEYTQIHAALVAALESGVLRPIVGRELPLAEAAQAHRAILADKAAGKLVLTM
jgi:NADPH2:quinone reductase